ncbi:ABC transporter substrate-binding protein [Teichococcus vastitatis]|uniref:ABC transporter substrate-binding protein n=1 Tax=Teichococcus vastitatis TaxID=2307076 RepID=A0ABS9W9C6_9PROT|nr:ABC transporter substrate-binding protein [Pseudoroseomonas vastitatis]MCI0755899.1 ABC transporter substrate-binding protein [Pseudoroseomonas vastitatis]
MKRRDLLSAPAALGVAAALPRFAIAQPAASRVLRFVPQSNLGSLDPVWTTANVTRNHAFMIYDTLYGLDEQFQPQPQMAEGHTVEDDGRLWTITLRSGLRFHDGEPVRARDCVASINRWMKRSPSGQALALALEEISAADDRRIRFRLQRPFPRLVQSLAAATNPIAFIMPERVAQTDPFKQITDNIGSGPFRFKADEYNSGSRVVYERNADYSPTPVAAHGLTAGPKQVFFDRVEWNIITDAATSAAALQSGEIDWFEQPPPEIQMLFARDRNISVTGMDPLPMPALLRLNHLHPPFNNKKLRQALLPAINQGDFMASVVGDSPENVVTGTGVFTPGTPLANQAGLEPLMGERSLDRARALIREAGYNNELMRLIGPTDILAPTAITQVAADLFRRLGFNMDLALSDWGTVVQRRASREPLDKGGWSAFLTSFSSFDWIDPAAHAALRANGAGAWPGWPEVPRIEALRDQWFNAPDLAAQKRIAEEIQRVALEEVLFIPVGAYRSITALRANLRDRVPGFAIFWNIKQA